MMMMMRMRMMRLGIKIRFPVPVGPSSCRCHYYHYYNNYRQFGSISKKSLFPSQQFGSSFFHERRRSLNVQSNNNNNNDNNNNNNNLDEKNNEDERSDNYNRNDDSNDNMNPLLSFSSINETPIGSTILEKPFTVILMEDNEYSMSRKGNDNNNNSEDEDHTLCISWMETFRSKIPRKYGMSFGSISIDRRRRRQQQNRLDCNGDDGDDEPVWLLFDELLKSLKHSELPTINDAVLIARGPVASLYAQYYLESCSLQGLIMIDPILINDNPRDNNDGDDDGDDDDTIALLRSRILHDNEHDPDQDRFRSKKLLIESNSVPMMVVLTVPNNKVWNRASRFVATRHSNPDGPYGMVEIIDLTTTTTANEKKKKKKNKNKNDHDVNNKIIDEAESSSSSSSSSTVMMMALNQINRWIDETL